uniref:UV radiation resistance-associated protein n=1 Tax=Mesocestoides corti TaxID=53468 RepID=A0A5K3FGS2_MESCO
MDIESAFHPLPKSYDVSQLKQILTLDKKIQLAKIRYNEIQEDLLVYLGVQLPKTTTMGYLNATHARLSTLRTRISEDYIKLTSLRSRAKSLRSEIEAVDKEENALQSSLRACSDKVWRILGRIESRKTELDKMLQLYNLRKLDVLNDLTKTFPIDVVGEAPVLGKSLPSPSDYLMTICGLLLVDSDAPGFISAAPLASWVDVGNGKLAVKEQSAVVSGSLDDSLRLSQSIRSLLLVNKPQTASTALAHVASLLQLVSSALDVPLRFPIRRQLECDFQIRIVDPFAQGDDESFPLYVQRNGELYRYAVFLLNLNITILRSFFNFPTLNQRASLWNLKNFLATHLQSIDWKQLSPCLEDNNHISDATDS